MWQNHCQLSLLVLLHVFICMWVGGWVGACHITSLVRGPRVSGENQFSPSFLWVPGIELRKSALAAGQLWGLFYRIWVHSYYTRAFVPVSRWGVAMEVVARSLKLFLCKNDWKWHGSHFLNPMKPRLNSPQLYSKVPKISGPTDRKKI